MHQGVPLSIKQRVIEDWMRAVRRDDIAPKHGIATGTVSSIIREWRADFEDGDIANAMRYFALAFRKLKLTIPQCALGARTAIMMNDLGIHENDFRAFISDTYKFLKELEVDPKKLAYCIKQMEDLAATMPISHIPQHISELDAKKKQILVDVDKLRIDELDMKARVDILKREAHDRHEEFQQFSGIKTELKKYGLEIGDLESFARVVKEADELGYDAHLIGSKLTYWDQLEKKELERAESVLKLERKKEALEQRIGQLEAKKKYDFSHGYSD